ncbi:TetR family transcriptional regulator [Agromyces luteolus]|uniref:TetR family transcriptional regulator n=1 Tax=Agromyces luteolus TaxID=88373 RepID=A0A7C9HN50_9MICO|nr:TetR/AcrR family transcriptional regulator [Agromyces luteolus]MUN08624.1 TetR family transcriptional regulator [Agromyces luteolus]GLK27164.1 TetR family transcriptional regulator [Agromyces luteolus]
MHEPSSDVGLRTRKRVATRNAIERAAISLMLEHGYDKVTVDMICEASMVSQRTFFNYFGSKEGVIIGGPHEPTAEQIDAFVSTEGPGIVADLLELIVAAQLEQEPDLALLPSRRVVLQRHPQLMEAEMAKMGALEDRYIQIVLSRFRNQHRPGTPAQLEQEARMVVALASGVMRYLMHAWFAGSGEQAPTHLVRDAVDVLSRFTQNELALGED